MTLDKPEHQKFLLELMSQVQFPGSLLEFAYEVKQSISHANIVSAQPNLSAADRVALEHF
jgi:hypothetical protein